MPLDGGDGKFGTAGKFGGIIDLINNLCHLLFIVKKW